MSPLVLAVIGIAAAQPSEVKAEPQPAVRVAVVNIGYVFNYYERAQLFKQELEATLQPYKDKAAKIAKNMNSWEGKVVAKDFRAASLD